MSCPLEPLAVVGISLKFPGDATSAESFWKLILDGRATSKDFPSDRLRIDNLYHPDRGRLDHLSLRGANFMEGDIDRFDAGFFSINAAEAEAMDPQQRLILEGVYHSFENAGHTIPQVSGTKTCVFAGSFGHDYLMMQAKDPMTLTKWHATGTSMNMLSNRVSWFFNLTGPSATVDTACSSSLLALDLVCQSLWSGDSSMGLAIGSNIILGLETSLSLDNLGLLSSDSRSYSFDQRGNGYSRGEGVGVLLIRPLKDAIQDGDTVRAVIRSSLSNQDGRTPGIMQPSMSMQAQLIRETYQKGGLDLSSTRYVETHGTGTEVGDPIEARAIGSVFRQHRSVNSPLYIGSVKSTIGHLEGASGVAGVIKAILALEKGVIPPNTDFQNLNPKIDDSFLNIKVANTPIPWPGEGLRRASVSSFGFGGSNTHLVLDDAYNFMRIHGMRGNHNTAVGQQYTDCNGGGSPGMESRFISDEKNHDKVNGELEAGSSRLLVWSSADKKGCSRQQEIWRSFFSSLRIPMARKQRYLDALAYTLCLRRTHLPWRTFAVVQTEDDWTKIVDNFDQPRDAIASPNLGLVFSGQGASWHAMGRELLHGYTVFRKSIQEANAYLQSCTNSMTEELQKSETESNVHKTEYSQTLCTALQVALVDLLHHFGIVPQAVVGHSSGEIAAAYCAHAISKHSAWKIAFYRGVWSSKLEKNSYVNGTMMVVGLSQKKVLPFFNRVSEKYEILRLTVACINSPQDVTVSGEEKQIDLLKGFLDQARVFSRKLNVQVAYHSFQMNEIATQYYNSIGAIEAPKAAARCPEIISSVTGTWIDPCELQTPAYWVRNLVSPVDFCQALTTMCSNTSEVPIRKLDFSHRRSLKMHHLLEVGPHALLQRSCRDVQNSLVGDPVRYYSLLVKGTSAVETVLTASGHLHAAGYEIDLSRVNPGGSSRAVLTDIPQYPFNHSKVYWHESQISKSHRIPKIGNNDLLGVPDPNWNPLEPRWRHIIRLADMPWVKDHQVSGTILYPAAGMLIMAIEAAKQLAMPDRPIHGFKIENTTLFSGLQISAQGDGTETGFYMRPNNSMESKHSQLFDFQLCTYVHASWTSNCTGRIRIVYKKDEIDPVDGDHLDKEMFSDALNQYLKTWEGCDSHADKKSLYNHMQKCGYEYGKAFQRLEKLSVNRMNTREVIGEIQNNQQSTRDTIHPTTLDAMIQTLIWSMTNAGTETIPTCVPTSISSMWVSTNGVSSGVVKTHTITQHSEDGSISTSIRAFDQELSDMAISLDGLECTAIQSTESTSTSQLQNDKLCHRLKWKPSISLLSNEEIYHLCQQAHPSTLSPRESYLELDFLMLVYIVEARRVMVERKIQPKKQHHKKYLDWMAFQESRLSCGDHILSTEQWRQRFSDKAFIRSAEARSLDGNKLGALLVQVGQHLVEFLNGEMDPLTFIFKGNLVGDFYAETIESSHSFKHLGHYIDHLAHENPKMKILEIGAGTGSATSFLLRTLGSSQDGTKDARYAHWDYTDLSRSFFGKAAERFAAEGSRMEFQILDIEQDPEGQGYECGTYDLVLASLVIHATSNLTRSLSHARKLLKPGGKLVFLELTNLTAVRTASVFGLLEGWWLGSEAYRPLGPCVDEAQWDRLLLETGFGGCELAFRDFDDEVCHETTLIISTAIEPEPVLPERPNIEIVHSPAQPAQEALSRILAQHYKEQNQSVDCVTIDELLPSTKPTIRIFLVEYGTSMLDDIQEELYNRLQSIFLQPDSILWVTTGGGFTTSQAHSHLIDGLFRVLSEEGGRQNRYVLSFEPADEPRISHDQTITRLVEQIMTATGTIDTEYIESDGTLYTGRVIVESSLNQEVSLRVSKHIETVKEFGCGVPLMLDTSSPCLMNGFRFLECDPSSQYIDPHDIEIEVKSAGLNFHDLLVSLGQLPKRDMGLECTAIVTRVGEACTRFKVGDRIVGLATNCFATSMRLPDTCAMVVLPETISYVDGASISVNFLTAYLALTHAADLRRGESVLIHSGAGGTGQAAIQLALYLGAEVFTTVGSEEKKRLLFDTYGIPEDHIFSSRTIQFSKAIMRRTAGKGVDVVFNSLSGEGLLASWECVAAYGRFIEIGKRDILSNSHLPMGIFLRNVMFKALDLGTLAADRPEICSTALKDLLSLIVEGKLCPVQPVTGYGIGEVESAFRLMQHGKHHGKLVVEMRSQDEVNVVMNSKPTFRCNGDKTYVIAGAFGGLGQNIVSWVVDQGARHLILLSRSGSEDSRNSGYLQSLKSKGVRVVAPACDITNEKSLRQVLEQYGEQMPPIKGCIQAAMVLRDHAFKDMTYGAWQEAVKPKVQGSWNLHQLLPKGMDFFVMLSSISGIVGVPGQANYASGNTFQDALARHRVSMGENGVSIDLGVIFFTGAVANNPELLERMRSNSVYSPVTEAEIHALLDCYCTPSISQTLDCQPSIGLHPEVHERGYGTASWIAKPRFKHITLDNPQIKATTHQSDDSNIAVAMQRAQSFDDCASSVAKALTAKLSRAMSVEVAEIDVNRSIKKYGVDSLVAIELRMWFATELKADIAIFDIVGNATIASLAHLAVSRTKLQMGFSV